MHIAFLQLCKSFELLLKVLLTKKRLYFGKPSEELEREWKNGIDELDGKCSKLLLQEHCKTLFNIIDIFWCDIKYIEADVIWLLKDKTHHDKLGKIQSKTQWKKSRKMSTNSILKKMVLVRFNEHVSLVSTANKIDIAKLKMEVENDRKLQLSLCNILETMKSHFHMRSLNLNLHLTQGTSVLL